MLAAFAGVQTFADLFEELGGVSPSRVRFRPAPGRATEKDVVQIEASENRLFELVDGVLVEKAMGATEALLASYIVHFSGTISRNMMKVSHWVQTGCCDFVRDWCEFPMCRSSRGTRFLAASFPPSPSPTCILISRLKFSATSTLRRKLNAS